MGTFVEISLFAHESGDEEIVSEAFLFAEMLEQIFSIHHPESDISRLNLNPHQRKINEHLEEALELALRICELSQKAFNPFKPNSSQWDLNGIAKGFVVDKVVDFLIGKNATLSGVVNAGGDMRFFNCLEREITLRLGSVERPISRAMKASKNAVASSSPSRSTQDPLSSTRYAQATRPGVHINDTVVVMAGSCAVSDALTKVGLFAAPERIQLCAQELQAEIILFNGQGDLIEVFS